VIAFQPDRLHARAVPAWGFAAILALASPAVARQDPGTDANGGLPPGAELMTRGPVHEAFAEPVVFDPKAGPVIPKQPPQAVQEIPPDQKPAGENVQWIPGYWTWDDARNDFLWVSGIWRIPPPGRQWVPGYWAHAQDGYQWASGSWAPVAAQDANIQAQQYLPEPPASIEAGPNVPAPDQGSVWAPGCWYWQSTGYAWRPGYWVVPQNNWLWVPAHYVWTPGGYVFVEGYWDHAIAQRGIMFAPVYFSQPLYAQPAFVYTPSVGLVAAGLLANLFVRPNYGHYYFGDYYAGSYFSVGIYPAYSYHMSRYGYDPIYAHAYAINRVGNPRWAEEMHEAYRYRRDHVEARPPHTWAQQTTIIRNQTIINNVNNVRVTNNVRNVAMAAPVTRLAAEANKAGPGGMRFERVDAARREAAVTQATQLRQYRDARVAQEVRVAQAGPANQPRRADLPKSPIVGPQAAARHEAMPQAKTDAQTKNRAQVQAQTHPHQPGSPPAAPAHPGVQANARPPAAGQPIQRHDPHPDQRPPQHHQPQPQRESKPAGKPAR
jgi:WXXGXW repeat (2 copies)